MAETYKSPTQKQRFDMFRILDDVCSTVDGKAVYKDGWSDARIAKEVDVSVGSVAYVRKDVFGNLIGGHNNPSLKEVHKEVVELRCVVNELKSRLTSMENDLFASSPSPNGTYINDS